nr:MAG: RNA-dependent RNA polymerase [Permutotetraviridae sp.]
MSNSILSANTVVTLSELGPMLDLSTAVVEVPAGKEGAGAKVARRNANDFSAAAGEATRFIGQLKVKCGTKIDIDKIWGRIAVEAKGVSKLECVPRADGEDNILMKRTYSERAKKTATFKVKGKLYSALENKWKFQVENTPTDLNLIIGKHFAEGTDEFQDAVLAGLKYCCTNGPLDGFLNRFIVGVNRPKRYVYNPEDAAQVAMIYTLKPSFLEIADETFQSLRTRVRNNLNADAGYPYDVSKNAQVKVGSEMRIALQVAEYDASRYWEALSSTDPKALEKWYDECPAFGYLKLKNKYERTHFSDVERKIRPYFCASAAQSIVWMAFWQKYCDATITVLDTDGSEDVPNAIGVRWTDGGCDKMVEYMLSVQEGALRMLQYTDDGWWTVRVNGQVYACCPDIEQLDLTESAQVADLVENTVKLQWTNLVKYAAPPGQYTGVPEELPTVWANALDDNLRMLFAGPYIFCKHMAANHKGGARSGVAGISIANQIVSLLYASKVHAKWTALDRDEVPSNAEELEGWLEAVNDELREEMGFNLKPSTMKWYPVQPQQDLGPVKFLGMYIFYKDGHYYPAMDQETLFASLWAGRTITPPPVVTKPDMWKRRVRMERFRAYAIVGGYRYPEMHAMLEDLFDHEVAQFNLLHVGEVIDPEFDEHFSLVPLINDYLKLLVKDNQLLFPPREWVESLYNGKTRVELIAPAQPKKHWADMPTEDTVAQDSPVANPPPKSHVAKWKNRPTSTMRAPRNPAPVEVAKLPKLIPPPKGAGVPILREKGKEPELRDSSSSSRQQESALLPTPDPANQQVFMVQMMTMMQKLADEVSALKQERSSPRKTWKKKGNHSQK